LNIEDIFQFFLNQPQKINYYPFDITWKFSIVTKPKHKKEISGIEDPTFTTLSKNIFF